MTIPEGQEVGGRLQRALEAFQKAQGMLLTAHRRLKELSPPRSSASGQRRAAASKSSCTPRQPRSSLPSGPFLLPGWLPVPMIAT